MQGDDAWEALRRAAAALASPVFHSLYLALSRMLAEIAERCGPGEELEACVVEGGSEATIVVGGGCARLTVTLAFEGEEGGGWGG